MDTQEYKQAIEDAIEGEIEAQKFYEDVSKLIKDDFLKELFEKFALEEKNHEKTLRGILNREEIVTAHFDFEKDFKVAETVEMPEVSPEMNLKDAIGIAMKNEEIAMKKYTAMADGCDDPELKAVFMDLAAMERGHKFQMEKSFVDVAYPEIW